MLSQSEMEEMVIKAKQSLTDEQIKDVIRRCSYGGSMVMRPPLDCQGITLKGGEVINGKTNA